MTNFSQVRSDTPKQTFRNILQAACPSCHPINSIKALKAKMHIILRQNVKLMNDKMIVKTTYNNLTIESSVHCTQER